jgi:hypothetical protein
MPICSLATAIWRSREAMSGRRSNNCDGTIPGIAGIVGAATVMGLEGKVSAAGGLPINTAMACSQAAR